MKVFRKLFIAGFMVLIFADQLSGQEIFNAALQGDKNKVDSLYKADKNSIETIDFATRTSMHYASSAGHIDIIKYLISRGMETNIGDLYRQTPLYYAAAGGHKETVDFLLSLNNNDLNNIAINGNSYLHVAANGGLKEFAEILIGKGVKINLKNKYGETPLAVAIKNEMKEFADFLISNGAVYTKPEQARGVYLGQKPPGLVPELFAPGIISIADMNERDVTFSIDEKEFYFSQWGGGSPFNIMFMKQKEDGWTNPEPASFSGKYQDAEAYFTPDEEKIFFITNRPESGSGDPSSWEIWFTERDSLNWTSPILLGHPFEGGFYTSFTRTWKMYYTQNSDLYYAKYSRGKFGNPVKLDDNINSSANEYNSFISPYEDYLIYTSNREGEYGEGDLYISFRKRDGSWTKAKNMGPDINSSDRDYCPSVSRDGKYFFFCSRKYGTEDIFWVDAQIIENLKPTELK